MLLGRIICCKLPLMWDLRGGQCARDLIGTPSPKSIGTLGHWKVEAPGCTMSANFLDLLDTGPVGGGAFMAPVLMLPSESVLGHTCVVLGPLRMYYAVSVYMHFILVAPSPCVREPSITDDGRQTVTTDGDDGPNNTPWAVVLNILGAIMYGKNNCALQRCVPGFV